MARFSNAFMLTCRLRRPFRLRPLWPSGRCPRRECMKSVFPRSWVATTTMISTRQRRWLPVTDGVGPIGFWPIRTMNPRNRRRPDFSSHRAGISWTRASSRRSIRGNSPQPPPRHRPRSRPLRIPSPSFVRLGPLAWCRMRRCSRPNRPTTSCPCRRRISRKRGSRRNCRRTSRSSWSISRPKSRPARSHRYREYLPLSRARERQGDALWHRSRPRRIYLGWHRTHLEDEGMAGLVPAVGDDRTPAISAAHDGGRPRQSARRARSLSRPVRSIESTAPTNLRRLARSYRPVASAFSTRTSRISTAAFRSARVSSLCPASRRSMSPTPARNRLRQARRRQPLRPISRHPARSVRRATALPRSHRRLCRHRYARRLLTR